MDRDELVELHFIAPIANLESIATVGILSHNRAALVAHDDVSSEVVQDRRSGKVVPDARRFAPRELHEYANVYVCGRNPMMYVLRDRHDELVLLRGCALAATFSISMEPSWRMATPPATTRGFMALRTDSPQSMRVSRSRETPETRALPRSTSASDANARRFWCQT
ncbi:MAG TPA: DarT ssDNA thymidine ADP-ribosyltransferase family protein [Solirubrobacteraceae bacterium]|nr:DarT ssDNA thymidine ADP-ribosyltransferase family protein [Solirubrobacteraceae bacterium]